MATKKTSIVVGERISFKPATGKRKAGSEEPAKLYGRVDSLGAKSMISVTFDDGSKLTLRKSRVVHEAPEAGLEKEDDDSSDNDDDDDDDDEVPGDDDDEEDVEAADVGSFFLQRCGYPVNKYGYPVNKYVLDLVH